MSTNRNSASAAATEVQVAYAHKGVLYLPHYTQPGLFVQPGMTGRDLPTSKLIKESTLVKRGANRIEMELLTRGKS